MAYSLLANAAAAGTGTTAVTGAIDTTGADLLIVAGNSFDVAISVSDSKGNSWSSLTEYGGASARVRLFYVRGGTVGSGHTFTITSTVGFPCVAVLAFSGSVASPFDQESGAGAAQPGSVTPSEDNELLVSGLCFSPSGTISINSSFSISNQIDYAGGTNMGLAMAYKIQTSAGAENPTWSTTTSFTTRTSNIATFKAAAAAAGHPAVKRMGGVKFAHRLGGHNQGVAIW